MDAQTPPVEWSRFTPGLLQQDLLTIPLEAGLIYGISRAYWPSPAPLFPFTHESTDKERQKTRHPAQILRFSALGLGGLGLGAIGLSSEEYALGVQFRGWIHAHLITELATISAKTIFQRKRPFYDRVNRNWVQGNGPKPREDDRFSFFSGHASHAFAFAGYSTALVLRYLDFSWFTVGYTVTSLGFATYIASARALDGQHNWSDVITGATIGYVVSQLVFAQTQKTARLANPADRTTLKNEESTEGRIEWTAGPLVEWQSGARPGIFFQGVYKLPSKGGI